MDTVWTFEPGGERARGSCSAARDKFCRGSASDAGHDGLALFRCDVSCVGSVF